MEKFSRRSMLAGVSGLAAGPQPVISANPGERAPIKPYLAMVMQPRVIAAKGMAEVHQNLDHVRKLIDQYLKGVWQLSGGRSWWSSRNRSCTDTVR